VKFKAWYMAQLSKVIYKKRGNAMLNIKGCPLLYCLYRYPREGEGEKD